MVKKYYICIVEKIDIKILVDDLMKDEDISYMIEEESAKHAIFCL